MKVVWSDRALTSLAAIHSHISVDSGTNAHRVVESHPKKGDQLSAFPLSGRTLPHSRRPNIRELIEQPYRIVYRVRRNEVEVIDLFHSARRPPWE